MNAFAGAMILLLLDFSVTSAQQIDEALRQRLFQEATTQWKEYEQLSRERQAIIIGNESGTINGGYKSGGKTEYKTNGRSIIIKDFGIDSHESKPKEQVFGINPRYAFHLSRRSPDSPWLLEEIIEGNNTSSYGMIKRIIDDVTITINYGVYFPYAGYLPLWEVISQPEFQIKGCRTVRHEERELVEVTFLYDYRQGNSVTKLSGRLLLDPSLYWCWHFCEMQMEGKIAKGISKFWGVQSDQVQGFPPLKRIWERDSEVVFLHDDKIRNHLKRRMEVTLSHSERQLGDEEFTLSAFGLPEPVGVVWEKRTPVYVWLLVAAGVLLTLALVFRWLARRLRRGTSEG
jgi:hypothetical protein